MEARAARFMLQAVLVARVYAGYKAIQVRRRLGIGGVNGALHRQHRRSAEGIYDMATRLQGLPIKVCQFLGSRADVLPDEYVEVLSQLQDRVPSRPLARFLPMLRSELGRPVDEIFTEISPEPVASASLAQVHRARLRDGRDVALKLQYPEIAGLVRTDLANFEFLVKLLARLEPNFDFRAVLHEVGKLVPLELDFVNEGENAERMAGCLAGHADVLVPRPIREVSSRRVLVTEFAPGVRCTDVAALRAMGIDPKHVAQRLSELFAEMVLTHGFFHGDPHPGNILVQKDGRLVLLDFGLAKEFAPGFREGVMRLTAAIVMKQRDEIAVAFRALGFETRDDSDESLAMLGEAFLGWALENGQAYADAAMIEKFNAEMPEVMKKNPLTKVPSDILLVGRVMGLLSGIGKQLGSEVDPAALLMPFVMGMPASASQTPT